MCLILIITVRTYKQTLNSNDCALIQLHKLRNEFKLWVENNPFSDYSETMGRSARCNVIVRKLEMDDRSMEQFSSLFYHLFPILIFMSSTNTVLNVQEHFLIMVQPFPCLNRNYGTPNRSLLPFLTSIDYLIISGNLSILYDLNKCSWYWSRKFQKSLIEKHKVTATIVWQ